MLYAKLLPFSNLEKRTDALKMSLLLLIIYTDEDAKQVLAVSWFNHQIKPVINKSISTAYVMPKYQSINMYKNSLKSDGISRSVDNLEFKIKLILFSQIYVNI